MGRFAVTGRHFLTKPPLARKTVYALAILCCLLWAGAYVTGKIAIGTPSAPGFGPFRTAFFRFAVAGVLLGAWGLWRDPAGLRVRQKGDWWLFGRLALLGMGLTYTFNYVGLALSTGTAAALLMASEPVWVVVLAVVFLRERLTRTRLAGIVFGFCGALLVVLSTRQPATAGNVAESRAALLGNTLIVASLLFESAGVLTVKRLTARYNGRTIVTYEFLLGALLLAPFAVWERVAHGPAASTPAAWAAFAYLLVACTLIAYVVWFRLLEVADASEITPFIFIQPVIGAILGVSVFGDPFRFLTAVGAILVLAAVWCIMWAPSG